MTSLRTLDLEGNPGLCNPRPRLCKTKRTETHQHVLDAVFCEKKCDGDCDVTTGTCDYPYTHGDIADE